MSSRAADIGITDTAILLNFFFSPVIYFAIVKRYRKENLALFGENHSRIIWVILYGNASVKKIIRSYIRLLSYISHGK